MCVGVEGEVDAVLASLPCFVSNGYEPLIGSCNEVRYERPDIATGATLGLYANTIYCRRN